MVNGNNTSWDDDSDGGAFGSSDDEVTWTNTWEDEEAAFADKPEETAPAASPRREPAQTEPSRPRIKPRPITAPVTPRPQPEQREPVRREPVRREPVVREEPVEDYYDEPAPREPAREDRRQPSRQPQQERSSLANKYDNDEEEYDLGYRKTGLGGASHLELNLDDETKERQKSDPDEEFFMDDDDYDTDEPKQKRGFLGRGGDKKQNRKQPSRNSGAGRGRNKPPSRPEKSEATSRPARGKNSKGGGRDFLSAKNKTAVRNATMGGRWKVQALRLGVFAALLATIFVGLKQIFFPVPPIGVKEVTAAVLEETGETGYPTAAADSFALRFATTWLTYNTTSAEQRDQKLEWFGSNLANLESAGWNGEKGKSVVTAGPMVSKKTVPLNKNYGVVNVAAEVNGSRWVYMDVPVYASDSGGLSVAGIPAYTPPPSKSQNIYGMDVTRPDDTAMTEVEQQEVVPEFFTAWAASDQTALGRVITPDATSTVKTGLGGMVSLQSVNGIVVGSAEPSDDPNALPVHKAHVNVTWWAPDTGASVQKYRLLMVKNADGRWAVQDVKTGIFSGPVEGSGNSSQATKAPQPDQQQTPTVAPTAPKASNATSAPVVKK